MKRLFWALMLAMLIMVVSLNFNLSAGLARQTPGLTPTMQPSVEPTQEPAKPDFIAHFDLPGGFAFILQKNIALEPVMHLPSLKLKERKKT